jgi:hypothetical protein
MKMDSRDSRMQRLLSELEEQFLSELEAEYLARDGRRPRITRGISRRQLLRSSAGTTVISAVGMAGLLELLANREAIAAGNVLAITGVTRQASGGDEPHLHTFGVRFVVSDLATLSGHASGRTHAVIQLGDEREEQHFHLIDGNTSLQGILTSGPEDNEPGHHTHDVSIE